MAIGDRPGGLPRQAGRDPASCSDAPVRARPHHSLRSAPWVPAKGGFGYSLWLSEAYPLLSATGSTIAA
jgi:hypothetical protein